MFFFNNFCFIDCSYTTFTTCSTRFKSFKIMLPLYKVEDKDIEHELGHMQEHNSRLVTVEDRALEN